MAARTASLIPHDFAVVGSGIVGATLACLLVDAGATVALIEGVVRHPARDEPYDLRTYSLTPASRRSRWRGLPTLPAGWRVAKG